MKPHLHESIQFPARQIEQVTEGEQIMELLTPYFERLAVARPDRLERYDQAVASGIETPNSRRVLGMVTCISDQDFNDIPPDHDYMQRREELVGNFATIIDALHTGPVHVTSGAIDWESLSYQLLDGVTPKKQSAARKSLRAAFSASLFADDKQVRHRFLRTVYALGLEDAMARALGTSQLSFVDTDSAVYDFIDFIGSFQASSDDVAVYTKLTEPANRHAYATNNPKTLLRQVRQAYEQGDIDEALLEATRVTAQPEEVETMRFDPYKIERFALQDRFIQDQANLLFSGTEVRNSPLAGALAQKAIDARYPSMFQLRADLEAAIRESSAPIVALYRLPSEIVSRDSLTERQAWALRYREVIDEGTRLARIDQYVNYETKAGTRAHIKEIWSTALEGADAPLIVHALLYNLFNTASLYYQKTNDMPAPEELYRLALCRRKHLIRIAMMNKEQFGAMFDAGDLSWHERTQLEGAGWSVTRSADGELQADIPQESQDPPVPSHKIRNGPTLGCPAGKISSQTIERTSRMGSTTNNFIDYIVELTIHEAYRRGLFDLSI